MRRIPMVVAAVVVCLGWHAEPALGQISIYSNPITGTNPNTANPYTTGQITSTNLTGFGIGRGPNINGTNSNNRYNANSWNVSTQDTDRYFTITFQSNAGYSVDISTISFSSERSTTGATSQAIRTSNDSYTTNVSTFAASTSVTTVNFSPTDMSNLTTASGFRIYGWNASSSTGTYSINEFTITGLVSNRWSGVTDGNLSSATNWVSGATPSTNNGIQFEGSTNTAVTVDAATTVQGIRFASGAAAFTVSGPNALTLGSSGGVANYSTLTQTINSNVVLGANQVFDSRSGSLAFGGELSEIGGARSLTIRGSNTVTLSGANTYTGTTTISGGTLLAANTTGSATGSGAITVSGTGVLSGGTGTGTTIGTVTGATNVQTGGTLRADSGSGTNTLTVGNVTIQNGGTLLANIAATNNNSTLAVGGNVLNFVTGSRLGLVGQSGFTSVEGGPTLTYNLATLSSGSNIRLDGNVAGVADGFVFGEYVHGTGNVNSRPVFIDTTNFGLTLNTGDRLVLNRTGNNLVLSFSPVPEPTTILGVAVGLVAVGGFIRKRLAKKAVVAA